MNKNQVKTLCKEDSWLRNDNQQKQRRLKKKELLVVTNWLLTKVH